MQRMGGPMGRGFMTEEEKKNRPKVTKELLFRVFSYLRPYWKQFLLILVCIAFSSLLALYPNVLTGRIVDALAEKQGVDILIKLILLSLGVTIGSSLIGVGQNYLNSWIAQHITFDMRNKMYAHLQQMSQRFFTTNNQGDIITRMTSDIGGVQSVITGTFTSILSNSITLIAALAVMYQRNWMLATLGVLVIPLFVLPSRRAGKTRWELTRESQACSDEINGILNETLSVSGQMLVKLFGKEQYEYDRYKDANSRMIRLNIKESMAGRWFFMVISVFSSIGPMLLYLVGGILMMQYGQDLTVGDITVMVSLLGRMYGPVNQLLNIQVEWIRSMALFTRIFEYFDLPVEIQNAPDAVTPGSADGSVAFQHVNFSYDPERQILHDVSFTLKAGHSIAIVGPSGSGKSTMMNIIGCMDRPSVGEVLLDGVDISKEPQKKLTDIRRDKIGLIFQQFHMVTYLTAVENVMVSQYYHSMPDEEEALEALERVGLRERAKHLPSQLSGGEQQRVCVARALINHPELILADEPTGNLDEANENIVLDLFRQLHREGTTLIVVTHDPEVAEAAQRTIVLEHGRVAKEVINENFGKDNAR